MNKLILILLFAGLLFLTVASIKFYQEQSFMNKSALTMGEVKGYQAREGIHQNVIHYPVIEFKDRKHRKQQFISDESLLTPQYQLGDRVEVYYQPDDPQKARIKKFVPQWGDIIGGFLIGTLLLLYSGVALIHSLWSRLNENSPPQHQDNKVYNHENIKIHTR